MAARAVTVTLGDMGDRADRHLASGRYASMSELVRAGLRALDRIEARIAGVAASPDRGTPRDDLAPGIRTAPFERGVTIASRVDRDAVLVPRVVSARRDLGVLPG